VVVATIKDKENAKKKDRKNVRKKDKNTDPGLPL